MMGFLGSVIADARASAPALDPAGSLSPVADSGYGSLNAAFASGAENSDAGWEHPSSQGKGASAADDSGALRSKPSAFTAPGGGLEPATKVSGPFPDVALSATPLALKPSEHLPGIDPPSETGVAAAWPESEFYPLAGNQIPSGASVEPLVDESIPREVQPRMTIAAPIPAEAVSVPGIGAYSPLPIGGKTSEQSPHGSEEGYGMADSPMFTSMRLPDQGIPPVSEASELRPLSTTVLEQDAPHASIAVVDPNPNVPRPEREVLPNAEHGAGVKPQSPSPAANTLFREGEKRPMAASVNADQAVREPSVVKRQEAMVHNDDEAAPIIRAKPANAVIHPQVADSVVRAKAVGAGAIPPGPYQGQRSPGSARSAGMYAMPPPPARAPEVKIGQVDVFIEAPERSANTPQLSQRPAHSLASRQYLRRV